MSESFRHLWGRTDDATPPTPDLRERVNYAAMMAARDENERDAARVVDAYLADHGVRWSPGAAQMAADLLALEALRAPAPSEAVAWQLVHTRTGQRWTPATDRASVENQQREFAALGATETRIAALVDHHPAPARGVTEAEAKYREALVRVRAHTGLPPHPTLDLMLGLNESIIRIVDRALTPDAEGGA